MAIYRPLEVGDTVFCFFDHSEKPITGRLEKLPTVNAPYWEVSTAGYQDSRGAQSMVCAFSGTVHVYKYDE